MADWLPDGSIVTEVVSDPLFDFNSIVEIGRTEANSASLASSFLLSEAYRGIMLDMAVDPSGTRVAMLFKSTEENLSFWRPVVLDIPTGTIHEPIALRESTDSLQSRHLHWSPDGQWLIFQDTRTTGFVPVNIAFTSQFGSQAAHTFAVRVDGRTHILPRTYEESTDDVRILLACPIEDPSGELEPRHARPATSGSTDRALPGSRAGLGLRA